LTSLSDITIEHFGRVGINNREAPVSVTTPLDVSNVRISNNVNSAGAYPGGGLVTNYLLDVTGSTFSNNQVTGNAFSAMGGAIAVLEDMFGDISDSTFINNSATYDGGAVLIFANNPANILNSQFIGNVAQEGGGGAVYALGLGSIVGSRFVDNRSITGGAVVVQNPASGFTINNSTFIANRTHGLGSFADGGALYLEDDIEIRDSVFLNNHVQGAGGGTGGAVITSLTNVAGLSLSVCTGSGSSAFMPSGVALTTRSKPAGSLLPVWTESRRRLWP